MAFTDQAALDSLVKDFLAAFTNADGRRAQVRRIYDLAIPSAVIIRAASPAPEVYSLKEFVEPRHELLTNGVLVDFEEAEESAQTLITGGVAQRSSIYR